MLGYSNCVRICIQNCEQNWLNLVKIVKFAHINMSNAVLEYGNAEFDLKKIGK